MPLTAYSQSTQADIRWSLIREQLLERQICVRAYEKEKERVDSFRNQMDICEGLIISLQEDEDDLMNAIQICEKLQQKAFIELSEIETENKELREDLETEGKRKSRWRGLAGVSTGVAAVCVVIVLSIK